METIVRILATALACLACAACTVHEEKTIPLDPNPPTDAVKPERIRENIRKIGEDLPFVAMIKVTGELYMAGKEAVPYLLEALKDDNPQRRSNAVFVLGEIGSPEAAKHIAYLLEDPVFEIRLEAARVLVKRGHADGIPVLIQGLDHDKYWVRLLSIDTLQAATKQYFGYHANDPPDRRHFSIRKWKNWWETEGRGFRLVKNR